MKKILAMVVFLLAGQGYAQAADPCAVVMCMRGAVNGQLKVDGCQAPVAHYFSIQVWSPKYNASATEKSRKQFISQCRNSSAADQQAIQNRYGRVMVDPSV